MRWLANIIIFAGKIQKKLKLIRARLISKKFQLLCQPFQKFIIKKRSNISRIFLNLFTLPPLSLTLYKWIKKIKQIQNSFRIFQTSHKTRVKLFLSTCLNQKLIKSKYWNELMDEQRIEIVDTSLRSIIKQYVQKEKNGLIASKASPSSSPHQINLSNQIKSNYFIFIKKQETFSAIENICSKLYINSKNFTKSELSTFYVKEKSKRTSSIRKRSSIKKQKTQK